MMNARCAGRFGFLTALTCIAGAPTFAGVREDIRRAIAGADYGAATIAYYAIDLQTGEVLVDSHGDLPLIPASNEKIITSGAALMVLGPDFSFETRMVRAGDRLVVIGSGDPALADPELLGEMNLGVDELLSTWVQDVKGAGAESFAELIVDARIFDDVLVHPDWPREQLNEPYCAQVSGLNFFANTLAFYPRPGGAEGASPAFRVEPDVTSWMSIGNSAKTTLNKKKKNSIWISRQLGTNDFTLRGEVRTPQQAPIFVTVDNMPQVFSRILADRLRQSGVQVASIRVATEADGEFTGDSVGRAIRSPLATVLRRCNQDSENFFAESLFKRIGHEVTGERGSWQSGAAVVRMLMSKRLDPDLATQATVTDGSGMSRTNRQTPRIIASWLSSIYNDPKLSAPFIDSLALAGENGTLKGRFGGIALANEVHAKSGYLSGVSCLSGFVVAPASVAEAPGGAVERPAGYAGRRTVAFSIMVNDIPANIPVSRIKTMQEKIVDVLDNYLQANQEAAAAPTSDDSANRSGG